MNKKWKISGLKYSKKLKSISDKILSQRINFLIEVINRYLKKRDIENLHDVRIALRRVRYNLELFFVCYDESTFSKFYKKIEKLQDLSGEVRDLDVLLLNLDKLNSEGIEIQESLKNKIQENRIKLENSLIELLNNFKKGKTLKQFLNEIKLEGGENEN
ncbi:MAG: CHAD domain-containing protein [Ignavibacterium sp.]|nr:CHAD domain-containing protein [Ignavibacterium sp.]MDW8374337.1 CHAD domain-containing protein [Ignavibacteriales bacterium]